MCDTSKQCKGIYFEVLFIISLSTKWGWKFYLVTKNHFICRHLTDLGMKFDKDSWVSRFC